MPLRSRWRRMCVESKFGDARMSASLKSTICSACCGDAGVARRGAAAIRTRKVAHGGMRGLQLGEILRGAVGRVRIADEQLVLRDGKILRQQRRQHVRQRVEPVVGRNDDGDFRHQHSSTERRRATISSRKACDRSVVCPRGLSNQHVRNAVRRPFLRIQPEIAVFERDDRRPSDGAGDVRRACIDGYDDATALENRRPLVKGQAAQEARDAIAALRMLRRHVLAIARTRDDDRRERGEPLDDRKRAL